MSKTVIFFCVFGLFFCQKRDLSNPFDPQNKYEFLDIDFNIYQKQNSALLQWRIPSKPDFKNIEIYKSMDGQNFTIISTLDNTLNYFEDSDIENEVKYSYYLRLLGQDTHSQPTRIKSIIVGPGNIWILDSYTWDILKLNYDLNNYSLRKNGIWLPQDLSIARDKKKGLITYPFFNTYEIFDLENGATLSLNNSIQYPYDATYDSNRENFWMIDSSGSLYQIDLNANPVLTYEGFSNPKQIVIDQNDLFILNKGTESIVIYHINDGTQDFISMNHQDSTFNDLALIRMDNVNKDLYILDKEVNKNCLYRVGLQSGITEMVYEDSVIATFDINSRDQSIWIVKNNGLNFQLVQLSNNVERLLQDRLFFRPRDIRVNPYNGNVIVADYFQKANVLDSKVFHYKLNRFNEIELIGSFVTYGDPFKVYIE